MNWLKNNVLWGSDEPEEQKSTTQATPAVQQVAAAPVFVTTPTVSSGVVEEKYTKHFDELLNTAKVDGVGYTQFTKALDANSELIGQIPEPQRYGTVLKIMKSTGSPITKETILSTAQQLLDVLDSDSKEADKAIEIKKDKEITSRQKSIEDINADTLAKQQEIQKLNGEIQANATSVSTLKGEIIAQTNIIEQNHQNYLASWNTYANKIKQDIKNISDFLIGETPKA